ncbi:MAG: hypothetical protein R6X02_06300 [Enhygromyxa sp.]
MRTTLLALGCIASVIGGAMLRSSEGPVVFALLLGLAALVLAWLRALGDRGEGDRRLWLVAASLALIGLARGASVGPPAPPQVPERGWGSLREFEVLGASEPGVRCEVELGDPRDLRRSGLRVSAPPENCPLAAGQRVAVLAQPFAERWRGSSVRAWDLGLAPALWLRPSPAAGGLRRIEIGYWHTVAALRQRAWDSTRGDPRASLVVAIRRGPQPLSR